MRAYFQNVARKPVSVARERFDPFGVAAERLHGNLESHTGAQTRLLENQRHAASRERIAKGPRGLLQFGRRLEYSANLLLRQIVNRNQILESHFAHSPLSSKNEKTRRELYVRYLRCTNQIPSSRKRTPKIREGVTSRVGNPKSP